MLLALGALYPLTTVYTTFKIHRNQEMGRSQRQKIRCRRSRGLDLHRHAACPQTQRHVREAKKEFFNNNQNSAAIKDQRVDAGFFFLNANVPAPVYMDLARTLSGKLHFFGPDEATIKKLAENEAGIVRDVVSAGSIPGYDKDVVSWGQMWTIMTNSKMSNDNAYAIVKSLYDNHEQITKYHPAGKFITKKTGLRGLKKLKMHPGAARYWKEAGMM